MTMNKSEFFFRPEFLANLRRAVKKYHTSARAASKHQWAIARLVIEEWERIEARYESEINKLYFYAATSHEINAVLPFPICTESGETLRRWCEVAKSYENADTFMFESVLSFDHFRIARTLAKLPKNEMAGNVPMVILLRCAQEGWTVEEMQMHYGDGLDKPSEFDKAVGWLDSLQATKFEWVKERSARDEIKFHLSRVREIVSEYEDKAAVVAS